MKYDPCVWRSLSFFCFIWEGGPWNIFNDPKWALIYKRSRTRGVKDWGVSPLAYLNHVTSWLLSLSNLPIYIYCWSIQYNKCRMS